MADLSRYNKSNIGKLFEPAVLPKNMTESDVRQGAREAAAYNCNAFVISSPYYLPVVLEELRGTDVLPCACIAFPFGATTSAVKTLETVQAVNMGAKSLDLVMNIGALQDRRHQVVEKELKDFKEAAQGCVTKVIIDVGFLKDEEIASATKMIVDAGIDYAKSATGQFEGPSMEQFLIMRDICQGTDTRLKVSGVKFPRPQNAYNFLQAGADIIGTRAASTIIDALDSMRSLGIVPPYRS